ncbi:MAG: hypothetical protein KAU58_06455, partial [Candidatus Omnitrophica bacterium]|nr:hypothetical protein [Candidatus Omnitrophota bacterium]
DNSPITIDKNYFLEKWNGIVLAFTKPSTGVELTAEEAKAIRGAGMLTESLIGEAAPYNLYYGVGSPYPTGATLRIDYYGSTETLTEERYYGQKKDELDNFYGEFLYAIEYHTPSGSKSSWQKKVEWFGSKAIVTYYAGDSPGLILEYENYKLQRLWSVEDDANHEDGTIETSYLDFLDLEASCNIPINVELDAEAYGVAKDTLNHYIETCEMLNDFVGRETLVSDIEMIGHYAIDETASATQDFWSTIGGNIRNYIDDLLMSGLQTYVEEGNIIFKEAITDISSAISDMLDDTYGFNAYGCGAMVHGDRPPLEEACMEKYDASVARQMEQPKITGYQIWQGLFGMSSLGWASPWAGFSITVENAFMFDAKTIIDNIASKFDDALNNISSDSVNVTEIIEGAMSSILEASTTIASITPTLDFGMMEHVKETLELTDSALFGLSATLTDFETSVNNTIDEIESTLASAKETITSIITTIGYALERKKQDVLDDVQAAYDAGLVLNDAILLDYADATEVEFEPIDFGSYLALKKIVDAFVGSTAPEEKSGLVKLRDAIISLILWCASCEAKGRWEVPFDTEPINEYFAEVMKIADFSDIIKEIANEYKDLTDFTINELVDMAGTEQAARHTIMETEGDATQYLYEARMNLINAMNEISGEWEIENEILDAVDLLGTTADEGSFVSDERETRLSQLEQAAQQILDTLNGQLATVNIFPAIDNTKMLMDVYLPQVGFSADHTGGVLYRLLDPLSGDISSLGKDTLGLLFSYKGILEGSPQSIKKPIGVVGRLWNLTDSIVWKIFAFGGSSLFKSAKESAKKFLGYGGDEKPFSETMFEQVKETAWTYVGKYSEGSSSERYDPYFGWGFGASGDMEVLDLDPYGFGTSADVPVHSLEEGQDVFMEATFDRDTDIAATLMDFDLAKFGLIYDYYDKKLPEVIEDAAEALIKRAEDAYNDTLDRLDAWKSEALEEAAVARDRALGELDKAKQNIMKAYSSQKSWLDEILFKSINSPDLNLLSVSARMAAIIRATDRYNDAIKDMEGKEAEALQEIETQRQAVMNGYDQQVQDINETYDAIKDGARDALDEAINDIGEQGDQLKTALSDWLDSTLGTTSLVDKLNPQGPVQSVSREPYRVEIEDWVDKFTDNHLIERSKSIGQAWAYANANAYEIIHLGYRNADENLLKTLYDANSLSESAAKASKLQAELSNITRELAEKLKTLQGALAGFKYVLGENILSYSNLSLVSSGRPLIAKEKLHNAFIETKQRLLLAQKRTNELRNHIASARADIKE